MEAVNLLQRVWDITQEFSKYWSRTTKSINFKKSSRFELLVIGSYKFAKQLLEMDVKNMDNDQMVHFLQSEFYFYLLTIVRVDKLLILPNDDFIDKREFIIRTIETLAKHFDLSKFSDTHEAQKGTEIYQQLKVWKVLTKE